MSTVVLSNTHTCKHRSCLYECNTQRKQSCFMQNKVMQSLWANRWPHVVIPLHPGVLRSIPAFLLSSACPQTPPLAMRLGIQTWRGFRHRHGLEKKSPPLTPKVYTHLAPLAGHSRHGNPVHHPGLLWLDKGGAGDPLGGQSRRQPTAAACDLCERHLGSPAMEIRAGLSSVSPGKVHAGSAQILSNFLHRVFRLCKSSGAKERQQVSVWPELVWVCP